MYHILIEKYTSKRMSKEIKESRINQLNELNFECL